jgi:hypothetical protein
MDCQTIPADFSLQSSGMRLPNLETILAARPHGTIGQAQQSCSSGTDRINTPREKAAVLAHLTIQLAMLSAEQEVRHGDA